MKHVYKVSVTDKEFSYTNTHYFTNKAKANSYASTWAGDDYSVAVEKIEVK